MASVDSIRTFRAARNGTLPRWYHWGLHLGANALLLFGAAAAALVALAPVSLATAAWTLVGFFAWSAIEYAIHRFILHGKRFSGTRLHREHSVYHHRYFDHDHMSAEALVDTNRVLIFTSDLVVLLGVNAGISTLLGALAGSRSGWIFFLAGVLYVVVYEIGHAVSHHAKLANLAIFRAAAAHHRRHHDPTLMARKNFSIVFPFWDRAFGSAEGERRA